MKSLKLENGCIIVLLILSLFFLFVSCGQKGSEEGSMEIDLSDPQKKTAVILKIEDTSYFNSDFEEFINDTIGSDQKELTHVSLSRLFDSFIEDKILLQGARNQQISLSWEEEKEYMAKLSNELRTNSSNVSVEDMNTRILIDGLFIDKYIYELVKDIEVEEQEIKDYYALHKREFLWPERVEVSQILVETEDQAVDILERVKNSSEEQFRKIAQEVSIGVEASKEGRMGLFEMGQLPFEMEKVIFSLKEGELSLVMESSYGYHIFRLDKRYEPELISEGEAMPSIRVKVLDQKIKQRISESLENLKKNLDWSFYPENLSFPYQRNSI